MATRTIGTEIVLSGEKQFNDAMKGVNNNLKTLRSDMARVTAEFADNADSMEALFQRIPDGLAEPDGIGCHEAGAQLLHGNNPLRIMALVAALQLTLGSHEGRQPAAVFPALHGRFQSLRRGENI